MAVLLPQLVARHAVAVNSGSTALIAALEAVGIGGGDEVITAPFSFIATANAVLERGASVRFADILEDDYCIDPADVERRISARQRAASSGSANGFTR